MKKLILISFFLCTFVSNTEAQEKKEIGIVVGFNVWGMDNIVARGLPNLFFFDKPFEKLWLNKELMVIFPSKSNRLRLGLTISTFKQENIQQDLFSITEFGFATQNIQHNHFLYGGSIFLDSHFYLGKSKSKFISSSIGGLIISQDEFLTNNQQISTKKKNEYKLNAMVKLAYGQEEKITDRSVLRGSFFIQYLINPLDIYYDHYEGYSLPTSTYLSVQTESKFLVFGRFGFGFYASYAYKF